MENVTDNSGRSIGRRILRLAAPVLVLLACGGCVTHPSVDDVFPDRLDQIPAGARVTVVLQDGRSIDMKVTEARADRITGTDRLFASYEIHIDEIREVTVARQNDTIVMLAWVAVVFVTGL